MPQLGLPKLVLFSSPFLGRDDSAKNEERQGLVSATVEAETLCNLNLGSMGHQFPFSSIFLIFPNNVLLLIIIKKNNNT